MPPRSALFAVLPLVTVLSGCAAVPSPERPAVRLPVPTLPAAARANDAAPTRSVPAALMLLSEAAIAACPVSRPTAPDLPINRYLSKDGSFQNSDGTLFTGLWPDGKVICRPGGPGSLKLMDRSA
jgi:hypothetical protein